MAQPLKRPAISVVPFRPTLIEVSERWRLRELASRLLADEPGLDGGRRFGPLVDRGLSDAPRVLLGDQSEIALMGSPEETLYGYRIALLAGEGDLLALAVERCPAYERYLRTVLGIDALDVFDLSGEGGPLAARCMASRPAFEHIARIARAGGGVCLVPLMASGHVWKLAKAVADETGTPVSVCGPSPRLSRRVNDKLWFTSRVREVLGGGAIPPTYAAYGPAALCARVKLLAERYERVVIKVPDSAGSAGNLPLEAHHLRGRPLSEIRARLHSLFDDLGWQGAYPLMVEVWEEAILSTPSVQLWVPEPEHGLPIVEGIFEQLVEGEEGKFVGAARARLPRPWPDRLAQEATRLAALFQLVGYFGRCSFDAIIAGTDYADAEAHWIECNGRWGGVSLPMTFINRIADDPLLVEPVIVQREETGMPARNFGDAVELLRPWHYQPRRSREGVILLTPTGIERGRGIHFLALAPTLDRARGLADGAAAALTQAG
ncbi:MAG: hypothetical protein ACR2PM_11330 [Hyphomicrobiales bacterium]